MLTITDLYCGAGGSTAGAVMINNVVARVASNHWDRAIETHSANHPDTDHIQADLSQIDPRLFPTTDLLWASPSCTKHSIAQGRKRQDAQPDLFGEILPEAAAEPTWVVSTPPGLSRRLQRRFQPQSPSAYSRRAVLHHLGLCRLPRHLLVS